MKPPSVGEFVMLSLRSIWREAGVHCGETVALRAAWRFHSRSEQGGVPADPREILHGLTAI